MTAEECLAIVEARIKHYNDLIDELQTRGKDYRNDITAYKNRVISLTEVAAPIREGIAGPETREETQEGPEPQGNPPPHGERD